VQPRRGVGADPGEQLGDLLAVGAHLGHRVAVGGLPEEQHEVRGRFSRRERQGVTDELARVEQPGRPAALEQGGEGLRPPAVEGGGHRRPAVGGLPRPRRARREVLRELRLDPDEAARPLERHVEVRRPAAVRDVQPLLEPHGLEAAQAGDGQRGRVAAPAREGAAHQRTGRPRGMDGDGARARGAQLPLRSGPQLGVHPLDVGPGERRHEGVGEAQRVLCARVQGVRAGLGAQALGEGGARPPLGARPHGRDATAAPELADPGRPSAPRVSERVSAPAA